MMNKQINIRLPEKLYTAAKDYVEENGFGTIQDFIKKCMRDKLFRK